MQELIESYEKHLGVVQKDYPKDAMELFVGGDFENTGKLLADMLVKYGLKASSSLIDFGCGSGRLATQLGKRFPDLDYTGIDILPEPIEHARSITPKHFKYLVSRELTIPASDNSADMVSAFSVFTHLYLEHSYLYMRDVKRILKPGGTLAFSFLQAETHWHTFDWTVGFTERKESWPLNYFTDPRTVAFLAQKLGFELVCFEEFGQTLAVLKKPMVAVTG